MNTIPKIGIFQPYIELFSPKKPAIENIPRVIKPYIAHFTPKKGDIDPI